MATDQNRSMKRKLEVELQAEQLKLKRLRSDQSRQVKSRKTKKARMEEICQSHPEISKILKLRTIKGRPSKNEECPDLLQTIIDVATVGGAADLRRRSDMIRTCKTLDQLHKYLEQNLDLEISRSAVYLRLLPRKSNSIEGKRHVTTVPVKLVKAQTSEHKSHVDSHFCLSTIRSVESLASLLGPHQVFYVSQDDKARIALGITAAKAQKSMIMHMQYRVTLPDHDWVKAERHKLIPSVYAGIGINEKGLGNLEAITSSGPTAIRIRSGKHSTSNASSHAADIEHVLNDSSFTPLCRTPTGSIKPIMIISSDGGADENPRYPKVIFHAVNHFKKYDLDALFIMTNAPGRSAYNKVERRMAPLSYQLSGLILQHDFYGSHLDNQGKTIDLELEKENFKHAGNTLCEIWNDMVIDKYPVHATYVDPDEQETLAMTEKDTLIDQDWFYKHVRTSQYFLQIVKCDKLECCKTPRSNIFDVLPNRFLPPPLKLGNSFERGLYPGQINDTNSQFVPLITRLAIKIQPNAPSFLQVFI